MPSSIKLYTMEAMEDCHCDAVTSEVTGYPIENALDFNPDTYWKPTSTADQTIDIDLGEAVVIEGYYFFLKNYKSISTGGLLYYNSSNGSAWNVYAPATINLLGTSAPHRYKEFSASQNYRWHRFVFSSMAEVMQISIIAFFTQEAISIGNNFPQNDSEVFSNKILEAGGGRRFTKSINKNKYSIMPRSYTISGTTNYDALIAAWRKCRGNALPLVINEGTAYTDLRLVYFDEDELDKNETSYQFYRPKVTFRELPYIDSGEVY